jgi:hypothetical protein
VGIARRAFLRWDPGHQLCPGAFDAITTRTEHHEMISTDVPRETPSRPRIEAPDATVRARQRISAGSPGGGVAPPMDSPGRLGRCRHSAQVDEIDGSELFLIDFPMMIGGLADHQQTCRSKQSDRNGHHLEQRTERARRHRVVARGSRTYDVLHISTEHLDPVGGVQRSHPVSEEVSSLGSPLDQRDVHVRPSGNDHQSWETPARTEVDHPTPRWEGRQGSDISISVCDRLTDRDATDAAPSLDLGENPTKGGIGFARSSGCACGRISCRLTVRWGISHSPER